MAKETLLNEEEQYINKIEMKKLLFICFLITSISIYAESKITFRGRIIDYYTQESISGAVINLYSGEKLVKSLYSNKNGDFEFLTVNPIEVIEVQFIGKLTLKIIEIGVWHEETKDFKKRQLSIHQIYRFD